MDNKQGQSRQKPEVDPSVHLLSSQVYRDLVGEETTIPQPVEIVDRSTEYVDEYPEDRSEIYGPMSDGELAVCSELLAEFAMRLQRDIDDNRVSPEAQGYADIVRQFSKRIFQSTTGPGFD